MSEHSRSSSTTIATPLLHRPTKSWDEEMVLDVFHSLSSFTVMVSPVTLTMLLASLVAVNVKDPLMSEAIESYLMFKPQDQDGTSIQLEDALLNSLVIVFFIIVSTVTLVICYKYNCMQFLVGYLLLSSTMLLGYMGGYLMSCLFTTFGVNIDYISFCFLMYNFTVVGVVAIFYQKGVSNSLSQGYLIATSVIMAWQLSKFPEWMTWTLLVVLGFYDLCAVLTPCGPLKWLVKLVEKEGRPLPGLLYEADVPEIHHRDDASRRPLHKKQEQGDTTSSLHAESTDDIFETSTLSPSVEANSTESSTTTNKTRRERLIAFYEKYNPEKVHGVDAVLDMYKGREREMWTCLAQKYLYIHEKVTEDRTIKLGLGDFVFYSVLVSRAAMYGVSTMCASLLVILMGLGGTLLLLSLHQKALPALPISIFLGTIVYFIVRFLYVPFMYRLLENAIMV